MKSKKFFSVGEAARIVSTTNETLRHYDRIGLVRPSRRDEWTGYRYYTQQDIVRLNTVRALQMMDIPLSGIRKVLDYDDLESIIAFLSEAEKKADEKIAALEYGKSRIAVAKADYERKLKQARPAEEAAVRSFGRRVILLSDTLSEPSLDNLWSYLRHFYDQIGADGRDKFEFEDLAGVYSDGSSRRMFALCRRWSGCLQLKELPEGKYLCALCSEEERSGTESRLREQVRRDYGFEPPFTVEIVVLSGILQWNYEVQVFTGVTG